MSIAFLSDLQPGISPMSPQFMENVVLTFTAFTGLGVGLGAVMFGLTLLIIVGMLLQELIQRVSRLFTLHVLSPVLSQKAVLLKRKF